MADRGRRRVTTLRTREHIALVQALTQAREKTGLSQVAVSRRIGLYDSFMHKVEKGDRVPDAVELIWLARGLGVDPRTLLGKAL